MRFHQPTIDYVARRTTEGLTKKDIIRCLKRFLAREVYQRVMADHQTRQRPAPTPPNQYSTVGASTRSPSRSSPPLTELLDRTSFANRNQARSAVFDYIEGFYNPHRRHSAIGCHSPTDYERSTPTTL